mmetsp:Transcript_23799/g.70323  ORF Transcript_23799/g.70323 Transcript_23799/m.70323 type:complete len:253 (-) Transcript_23799:137-895(-)
MKRTTSFTILLISAAAWYHNALAAVLRTRNSGIAARVDGGDQRILSRRHPSTDDGYKLIYSSVCEDHGLSSIYDEATCLAAIEGNRDEVFGWDPSVAVTLAAAGGRRYVVDGCSISKDGEKFSPKFCVFNVPGTCADESSSGSEMGPSPDCESSEDRPLFCKPRMENGKRCFVDDECISGECSGDRCRTPSENGSRCSSHSDCAADDYCSYRETCAAKKSRGQLCFGSVECKGECKRDLYKGADVCYEDVMR